MSGTTPAESTTPRNPIPLTGTWFGRVGMTPYELIDTAVRTTPTVVIARRPALPTRVLAA